MSNGGDKPLIGGTITVDQSVLGSKVYFSRNHGRNRLKIILLELLAANIECQLHIKLIEG